MIKVFTIFNVLLYFSYAFLYLWQAEVVTVKPLYWFLASISLGFVLLAFKGKLKLRSSVSRYTVAWALVLILLYGLGYTVSVNPDAARDSMIAMGESALMLILFIYLMQDDGVRKAATVAVLIVVIVSVMINFYDFLNPMEGRFTSNPGRAAGMYVNSNLSGSMLVFGMALSVWILPKRLRFAYCIFVALGVLITFSRSSIMMWVLAVVALSWSSAFYLPRVPSLTGVGAMIIALSIALAAGVWLDLFRVTGTDDYLTEDATNRIGGSFFAQKDDSSQSRVEVAKKALQLYLRSPVFGQGLGASGEGHKKLSVHNMYLLLAIEFGFFGLLLMFALLFLLWMARSDVSRLILLLYSFAGLFGHNYFEQPAVMLVIALAVASANEMTGTNNKMPVRNNRQMIPGYAGGSGHA